VISLFHIIQKEQAWRKQNGKPEGFDTLRAFKPMVAVGAEEPLADQLIMADYFRMLGGSSSSNGSAHVLWTQTAKTASAISIQR